MKIKVLIVFLLIASWEAVGNLSDLVRLKQPTKTNSKWSWLFLSPAPLVFDKVERFFTDIYFVVSEGTGNEIEIKENSTFAVNSLERILMRKMHNYKEDDKTTYFLIDYFFCKNSSKYFKLNMENFSKKKIIFIRKSLIDGQTEKTSFFCQ